MEQDGKTTRAVWPSGVAPDTVPHMPPTPEAHELVPTDVAPAHATPEHMPAHAGGNLPAVAPKRVSAGRWWLRAALALVVLIGGAGGGYYWWQHLRAQLPPGIAFGNGRLEADEIDIDTKYAGRIAEILADEGDVVKAGQVVARMDTQDLGASLKKSQSQVLQAKRAVDEANANVVQQSSQVLLAQQEMDRATALVAKGYETKEVVDQRKQQLDGANAALAAAQSRVTELQHALDAATHDVELY